MDQIAENRTHRARTAETARVWGGRSIFRSALSLVLLLLLGGCFWTSSSPDLDNDDHVVELVVLWNTPRASDQLERANWSTRDTELIGQLTLHLQTETWTSSSVLPGAHETRIILSMRSGRCWEIVLKPGDEPRFGMFERNDRGRSGSIAWSAPFLAELTARIEAEVSEPTDLEAEHRSELRLGTRSQSVPAATQAYLDRFPGYPEMRWNASLEEFEYPE